MLADTSSSQQQPHTDAPQTQVYGKKFEREKHIKYFKRCLQMLPHQYTSMDTHRLSLGCFVLSALELLGALDEVVTEKDRKDWIEWIYAQQRTGYVPTENEDGKSDTPHACTD
ncbi:hypothetical protein BGW42_007378 [Actinomortierella wolfii]|nr:hypothetical protein BGW42_007378 [Actinomortierella wolfii]